MSSSAPPWPAGVDLRSLGDVDSTNTEAARHAASLTGPTWFCARSQTAGRGRHGRSWQHPEGNFAATLAQPVDAPATTAAWRSFTAALSLADALDRLTGAGDGIALKWPNDVLLNRAKIAGILLETDGARHGVLLVGIGVNLVAGPPRESVPEARFRPSSLLAETGCRISPAQLLDHLAPAMDRWETRLAAEGFGPARAAFLDRAANRGGRITARTARDAFTGTFEDIDPTGALVLATEHGRVTLPAADVFF